jgi:predicted transcriptional regulator
MNDSSFIKSLETESIPLLSIKPEYSEKIFEGTKKVELRKKIPKAKHMYFLVYESSPTQSLRGLIKIKGVKHLPISEIISGYSKKAAVKPQFISEYYRNHDMGYVIEIEKTREFKNLIKIDSIRKRMKFSPPQNYMYFNPEDIMPTT